MAARTSSQAGNWNLTATWGGNPVPVDGDTCTINHAITVSDAQVVGTSPATGGTDAIVFGTAGKLTIDNGGALKVRGPVTVGSATTFALRDVFVVNGILEIDASQAATPSAQEYEIRMANNNFSYTRTVIGATGILRSNAGGGNGFFTTNGQARCNYLSTSTGAQITRIGDATNPAFAMSLGDNAESELTLAGTILDACGKISCGIIGAAAIVSFTNTTWKNTVGDRTWEASAGLDAPTGTRVMTGCVHDVKCNLYGAKGMTIGGATAADEVIFDGGIECTASSNWASMRSCFIREAANQTVASVPEGFSMVDCYLLNDYGGADPHFISDLVNSGTQTQTITRHVWETAGGGGAQGNGFLTSSPAAARTTTMRQVILLPDDDGDASSNLVHHFSSNTNHTVDAQFCTVAWPGDGGGVNVTTNNARFSALKNNLFWKSSADAANFKVASAGGTADDADSIFGGGANADYNGAWNSAAGSALKGYDLDGWTVAPGANDVSGDPDFVDSTRKLSAWDTSLGGAGTRANARTEMKKRNEAGFNSAYSVRAAITYVESGFAPQNIAYRAASDGTSTIGAVEGVFPTTTGYGGRLRLRLNLRIAA